jgi:DNA-binding SARP family transcriptional activator
MFERALANFERDQDGVGAYLAWAGAVQALTYEQRSYQRLDDWLQRLARIELFSPAFASAEVGSAVVSSMLMGLSMTGAESAVLEHWVARAMALSEKASDPSMRVMIASVLVLNFALRGDSGLASTWLPILERQGANAATAVIGKVAARAATSALAWRQGQLAVAVDAALEGLALLGANSAPMWQDALLVFGTLAAIDHGAMGEAEQMTTRFAELASTGTGLDMSGYHVVRAYHALANGELKQALLYVELSVDRDTAMGFAYGQSVDLQIAAYLHFELGDEANGREALRKARQVEEAHRQPVLRYFRLVIEADRALKAGDLEAGLTLLRGAFGLGREHEIYNVYCPPPARMAELCQLAFEHNLECDYARTLVRRKDLFRYAAPLEVPSWPWPIQIRTLGGLEVLLDDQPLALGRARMPLLLLRLLVTEASSRAGMPIARVLAALWPESDGDNATHAFEMTTLRLRNQLGDYGRRALRVERGCVFLDAALCWTDTAALLTLLGEIATLEPEAPASAAQLARSAALADRLLTLYRGPFAEEEDTVAPLAAYGQNVRAKAGRAAHALGARLLQLGDATRAETLYLRLLEVDPLLDALLAPAVTCLMRSGRRNEARALLDARKRRLEPVPPHDLLEAERLFGKA